MRVFTRIVGLGEGLWAIILIKQLEAHLGVQLLQRTTPRQARPWMARRISTLRTVADRS